MKISLKSMQISDIDDQYCSWFSNDDGHLNYFTGSNRIFDRETLIQDFQNGQQTGRWYYYLIISEYDEKIGCVKIGPIDTKNKTSDLVCLIGSRQYTGQGLATKAIEIANDIAFKHHDIRRLQGGMYESNIASIKAYTRAGWIIEGKFEGFYWVNNAPENRICVACFNPKYFPV